MSASEFYKYLMRKFEKIFLTEKKNLFETLIRGAILFIGHLYSNTDTVRGMSITRGITFYKQNIVERND